MHEDIKDLYFFLGTYLLLLTKALFL